MRILVVEDESLIAMQLEDMLLDLGCEVVGPASRIRAAQQLLDSGVEIDCAVLDVNISGELVYPVAKRLDEAGIPIVFATGYGREGVEPHWRDHPILQKPYTIDQIGASISLCRS
ncbi:response regulator [Jiella marina]|uniref:response regulator n=1 Tax=Jiella sp. LLJ827 TaxID=2917712 RepID=UPI0021008BB5|nr:response regulator [Jiella sp. LLJ827]MCQ0986671.1 response regulator [Jiella sp. LLJ827]